MNRPLVFCMVFLAGLVIGGAGSWLVLDLGDRAKSSAGPQAPPVASISDVAPRDLPVAPVRSESRAIAASLRPKAFNDSEERVAGDLGIEAVGTGAISGKVKNDKGQPVPGVVVRAEFQGDRRDRKAPEWRNGDGPPPEKDMQSEVARFVEETEKSRAMRKSTTTGENGEFTLSGLLDDRYSVQAYLKGFLISADQSDLAWNARPGAWVEFTANRVQIVPVEMHLPDGAVPKRANVIIHKRNSTSSESWRPENPEMRLGAGSYALSASAGDHDEWHAEQQNVVLKEGETPAPVSFKLMARTGIRGRVRVPKGYALDSLSIFATRYAGTAPPDESALKGGQNSWASQWNGYEFTFHDLAAGNWLIGAGTWESIFTTKSVEVKAGAITEVALEIADASATGLVVKVVGPDGNPVADASVRAYSDKGSYDGNEQFIVRPKTDGAWVISAKKEQGSDVKDCWVQAHSERYGEKTVALPALGSGEIKIELAEPATLEVTVTGYAGSGLENRLHVEAQPLLAGKDRRRVYYSKEEQLGPDGRQTLRALQPGRYRVELQYAQERWNHSALDHVDVDVAPGANSVSIAAPAVYTLTVILGTDASEGQLNLQQVGTAEGNERWHRARPGTDGTATFEGLVAGTYRLSIYGSKARRQKSMKVTVPAAGPVTFKEDVETALIVKALDSEGFLAGAGFQVGDTITGVDGTPFDGSRPAAQVLMGLITAKKELKLQFTRSGKALEVTVDSEKFAGATNHGRALEPGTR